MTDIAFDPAAFRKLFPIFADVICQPDAVLQGWFNVACLYISNQDSACFVVNGDTRAYALDLMTAHVGYLFKAAANGDPTGIVTQATIDKVTVAVKAPPIQEGSMLQFWLAQSPFGQQLLALLSMKAAGGLYIGGSPERYGFRRVGGGFGPTGGRW
jgi:hypothetical protein